MITLLLFIYLFIYLFAVQVQLHARAIKILSHGVQAGGGRGLPTLSFSQWVILLSLVSQLSRSSLNFQVISISAIF